MFVASPCILLEEKTVTQGMNSRKPANFIEEIIEDDLQTNRYDGRVHTRFPPEPNGYLHIGHAKAICIDFGIAAKYNGLCNLRFDDTNPTREEQQYIDSIKEDIRWLGFDWEDREYYASDYYGQLYDWAVALIEKGKAYVDDLSAEQIREYRGTLTSPGKESPFRNRSIDENLDLLSSVPKIGKKLASKIVLELKGKLKFEEKSTIFNQAVNALCSLGLNRGEAIERLKGVAKNLTLEEMVKQALRR